MRWRISLGLGLVSLLVAQSQPTFYAAYQDGLDAEHQERWASAVGAYRRAIELRPASAARIVIYGNNLLKDYAPYTHLARCLLKQGEVEAAQAALTKAVHFGEPSAEREVIARALDQKAQPVPASKEGAPAPPIAEPVAKVHVHTPADAPEPSPHPIPSPTAPDRPLAVEQVVPAPSARREEPPPRMDAVIPPLTPTPSPTGPVGLQERSRPISRVWWFLGALFPLAALFLFRRHRNRVPEESSFKDPEQLGPYRIERLLGRGGFASTYLAYHTTTRRPVALKLLHPFRHDDPEFIRRFRQEAKLGAMLDHPNLVRMLDPGPESGLPWLAMEYISGRRLDQRLREEGPPSVPDFVRIALEIARAMAYAHSLGIVHRDLKPGNVIFEGDQVKVMDFGISRFVDSGTLTTTYAFLGTPRYAAPEAQLKSQVGPAADRYAFGIMLFELLAGHPPFDGETPFEILAQHQKSPLPDLALLRPDLPNNLVDLIHRLCRKNPDERPGDEEVITTLESIRVEPSPSAAR